MENYIGRLLDNRYEILEVIGTGGMAVVYKALDHRLNRLVAVKILKDDLSRNQEFRRRFHAESQAVAMLSHPNIVSVYDVSRSGDADYIVMELIEGISLKQYLEKKINLNWRETLHFSIQIAKALDHAHSRGIVHRDIKPHNILILKDGSIKVADFGIARVGAAQHTLTREALGSVHYISPEQAKGARVDNRSDLYSLGVVMYEMLTGRTPYDGDTPVSVAIQHINGGARRPSELMAGIPLGLEQITMHAMTASADERYPNASDMLRDMEEFRKNPSVTFRFGVTGTVATAPAATAAAAAAANSAAGAPRQNAPRTGMTRSEAERYAAARNAQNPDGRTPEERRAERARREAEAAAEKRRKTLTIAIIVAASVLAVLVVIAILAGVGAFDRADNEPLETVQEGNVRVPTFVGMKLEDIDPDDYPDLEVDVKNVKEEFSDEYEEGVVMEQSPKAKEEVRAGRKVTLTVSKGAEEKKMPDLKNVKEGDAMKKLEELKLGLKITVKDESNSEIDQGKVIRTDPPADSKLKKEQEVTIYVSLGENKMPDLRKDTKNNAESRLKALELGLKITFLEEESDEIEKDRVIRTEPAAGSQLNKDDKVTIYISTGSGKIPMPDLLGMSETQAVKKLEDLKLSYRIQEVYDPVVPEGYVVSQSVKPYDKVSKDQYITIDISKGVDPATTTSPTEPPTMPPETDPPTDPTEAP